jgi:predicted HicB family RNase H-like nuclease
MAHFLQSSCTAMTSVQLSDYGEFCSQSSKSSQKLNGKLQLKKKRFLTERKVNVEKMHGLRLQQLSAQELSKKAGELNS